MPTSLTRDIPRRRNNKNWTVQYFPEAASQSFKIGDIVQLNSSGQVAIGATAGNDMTAASNLRPLGIVSQDATGVTNSKIKVLVPHNGAQFLLPVEHATPASAVTAESQTYKTAVTGGYVLTHTSGGVWAVAIDTTTNPIVNIMDICEDYPVGEQYGTVWVSFLPAVAVGI